MDQRITEQKTYWLFHGMPRKLRLIATAVLLLAGFILQLRYNVLIGLGLILCASFLNMLRSIKLTEPESVSASWERVTLNEFTKALERINYLKKWQTTSGGGRGILVIILTIILFASVPKIIASTNISALVLLDFYVLFVPLFLSGVRRAWSPPDLEIKLNVLSKIIEYDFIKSNPEIGIQPFMQLAKDVSGANYPVDCKLMIEFEKAPKDFLGVQVQVSINKVGGISYPYAYAVIIAKSSLGLPFRDIKSQEKKILYEPKKEGEMDILVIRQATTKTSGYQTDDDIIRSIVQQAVAHVLSLFK